MPHLWTIESQWWKDNVGLPRTPAEWHRIAHEARIDKGIWPKGQVPDLEYPKGARVSTIPLRRLGGWGSGSKIQMSHYLTTRILWRHRQLISLVEESSGEFRKFSPEVRKKAMQCCKNFLQFKAYCEDIEKYGGTKPKPWHCDLLLLGPFSTVRSLQYQIRCGPDVPMANQKTTPAANTRRQTGHIEVPSITSDHSDDSQHSIGQHGTEDSGISGGFTAHIKEFSAESAAKPQTAEKLNTEKLIESTFISFLHSLCLKLGNLDVEWGHDSPQRKASLGKASIVAAHDGQLQGPNPSRQPEAIIEVKGSALLGKHMPNVLMHIGVEMMIWMLKCQEGDQPKSGHYMFCQFGHEYWVVSGNCSLAYFDYLAKEPVPQAGEAPFLKLDLYGPFNMFNADHVFRFGPIVAGVTLQGDVEYKASLL